MGSLKQIKTKAPIYWTSPDITMLRIESEINFMTSGNVDKTAEYEYDDANFDSNSIWK